MIPFLQQTIGAPEFTEQMLTPYVQTMKVIECTPAIVTYKGRYTIHKVQGGQDKVDKDVHSIVEDIIPEVMVTTAITDRGLCLKDRGTNQETIMHKNHILDGMDLKSFPVQTKGPNRISHMIDIKVPEKIVLTTSTANPHNNVKYVAHLAMRSTTSAGPYPNTS